MCGGGGSCPAGKVEVVGDAYIAFAGVNECSDFANCRDDGDSLAAFGIQGESEGDPVFLLMFSLS